MDRGAGQHGVATGGSAGLAIAPGQDLVATSSAQVSELRAGACAGYACQAAPQVAVDASCLAPLCTLDLPPLPPNQALALSQGSLVYSNPSGTYLVARNVDSSASCARGWHYTEDLTQVEICRETCKLIQSTPGELEMMVVCVSNGCCPA
jgi:hypothetical protein